ncbi:hypothetical protein [Williamsia phyllosphaerae]|uniref:DUF4355 domain-containing protein n=1 Tax=Williamsia phyllosphaerae TaxID=885042 RepID=A0ABQ1V761_9NOCA|nr:hypothetical protein [Williamsia phyllosphaerae]GGF39056.1 hypothetical protein GCM10007298_38450 [Williamsia phyllosphaerae]
MSDESTTTPDDAQETTDTTQGDPADLGDGGKKALVAERRRANSAERELKDIKAQLEQIEAAKLSDLEKAQKLAAEAQAEAVQVRAEALRYRIAAKHSITDEDAELFLTGGDEETLTRQALRLAERNAETSPKAGVYVPQSGQTPSAPALNGDDLEQSLRRKLGIG